MNINTVSYQPRETDVLMNIITEAYHHGWMKRKQREKWFNEQAYYSIKLSKARQEKFGGSVETSPKGLFKVVFGREKISLITFIKN